MNDMIEVGDGLAPGRLTRTQNARLDRIYRRADAFEDRHVGRPYYFRPDHGGMVCRACLERLVRAGLAADDPLPVQAEWLCDDPDAVHDLLPLCSAPEFRLGGREVGCGRVLHGNLTTYGAREELASFADVRFDVRDHEHCYRWRLCEDALGLDGPYGQRLLDVAGF